MRWISILLMLLYQYGIADVGLYKHIDLSRHSVKDCRMTIGDMNGDEKIDFLFFDGARTMKAFDHNGNLMWEKYNADEPG